MERLLVPVCQRSPVAVKSIWLAPQHTKWRLLLPTSRFPPKDGVVFHRLPSVRPLAVHKLCLIAFAYPWFSWRRGRGRRKQLIARERGLWACKSLDGRNNPFKDAFSVADIWKVRHGETGGPSYANHSLTNKDQWEGGRPKRDRLIGGLRVIS